MNIEKQVCTLEQAKRLEELGVSSDSVFYYTQDKSPKNPNLHYHGWEQDKMPWDLCFSRQSKISGNSVYKEYPAYTVAELGVMLPSETYTMRTGSESSEYANWEWVDYGNQNANGLYNTEAEARAALLIYLIQHNIITAEEVNTRLNNNQ